MKYASALTSNQKAFGASKVYVKKMEAFEQTADEQSYDIGHSIDQLIVKSATKRLEKVDGKKKSIMSISPSSQQKTKQAAKKPKAKKLVPGNQPSKSNPNFVYQQKTVSTNSGEKNDSKTQILNAEKSDKNCAKLEM